MAEVNYGQPCPSTAPDGAACAWSRSHKNDHRDAASNGRCWTGGIRTAPRWRCPRGGEYAPCGTCPTCLAKENPVAGPKRVQRKRTKGWRMPDGAIYVGRPTKWGNPCQWKPGQAWGATSDGSLVKETVSPFEARTIAVSGFVRMLANAGYRTQNTYPPVDEIRAELAGHDLVCWCPLDQPCHADVLLELANGGGR